MTAQILLLRGINVGGHGKLPMADLRALLDALGAGGARSHGHAGSVLCPGPVDVDAVIDRIEAGHGFRPVILALSAAAWRARMKSNPFSAEAPGSQHGFFHHGPALDTAALMAKSSATERVAACPGVLWLHAPDGIGRSKLAASVERLAGRPVTARNGNTVAAITELLDRL
jgi:uncharacterized protein (DUF1697 family)